MSTGLWTPTAQKTLIKQWSVGILHFARIFQNINCMFQTFSRVPKTCEDVWKPVDFEMSDKNGCIKKVLEKWQTMDNPTPRMTRQIDNIF